REWRVGKNAYRWGDDLKIGRSEFLLNEISFIFPRQEHVADAALRERRRRTARAGVEQRHVLVERGNELARLCFVVLIHLQCVAPRREICPARPAGSLRIWRNHLNALLDDVWP